MKYKMSKFGFKYSTSNFTHLQYNYAELTLLSYLYVLWLSVLHHFLN